MAQRFFLYEYLTAGGAFSDSEARRTCLGPSIAREGAAMLAALALDFLAIPGTEVVLLRDSRSADLLLPECPQIKIHSARDEREAFSQQAAVCDGTLIIAPEQGQALLERTRWAEAVGASLLSPDSAFVSIAADKNRTADLLQERGVPIPAGVAFHPGNRLPRDFRYPAVLKPADGAGSIGVQRLSGPKSAYSSEVLGASARLESLCPGLAASVAVLCGPCGHQPLPPCLQRLSDDGHFRYLGGSSPIEPALADRAAAGFGGAGLLPGHVRLRRRRPNSGPGGRWQRRCGRRSQSAAHDLVRRLATFVADEFGRRHVGSGRWPHRRIALGSAASRIYGRGANPVSCLGRRERFLWGTNRRLRVKREQNSGF